MKVRGVSAESEGHWVKQMEERKEQLNKQRISMEWYFQIYASWSDKQA